ncbi:solute carrier organic anion transporter family member 4A1-like [Liolophura sinensis]|uniref:solute carrier organic anion transporter family member 4A1-like n=1 Tax=Liolophura sinensis TaxID=3198878 RepID=UPI00315845E4
MDERRMYHRCCNRINSIPWFVFFCCVLNFLEGYAVNGITSINLTALEVQFQLTSTRSGLIASATNIGALTCVLAVSFLGTSRHKPIWTGAGAMVMAIGSLLFIVPHWAGGNYQFSGKTNSDVLCDKNRNISSPAAPPGGESPYLWVLMLANALHGAGYTPLYTLAIAYIEENENFQLAGFHVGLFYASAAVGVATGFLSGGQFLQFYVDFDRVDMDSINLTPNDQGFWVGAWWLGYIVSTAGFVLFALPLFGYPKHMKGYKDSGTDKPRDGVGLDKRIVRKTCLSFAMAFVRLFRNPVFVLLTLAASCVGMIINGISSFSAKYLYEQFGIRFDVIGYILGGLIVLGSGGGMVLGGALVRVMKLEIRGIVRLCLICVLVGSLSGIALLARCPDVNLVGLNSQYANDSSEENFVASCNVNCACDAMRFSPVCGSNSTVFFSPCHAGCSHAFSPLEYTNCTCAAVMEAAAGMAPGGEVKVGRCPDGCQMIYVLIPFLLLMFLSVFTITTPVSMATLRCVQDDLRPFALGVQWTVMRLLGFIPGPVFLGFVIDQSCALWSAADDQGVCLLYHKGSMALYVALWWIVMTIVAFLFFVTACRITERRASREHRVTKD